MDDTKLLELAGRAAGEEYGPENNPLDRDDLALRLAVKLGLKLTITTAGCAATKAIENVSATEHVDWPERDNIYAATRRAIVRVAAAIGEQMP